MADTRSECWDDNTSARLLREFLFCVGRRLRDLSREGDGSTGLLTMRQNSDRVGARGGQLSLVRF